MLEQFQQASQAIADPSRLRILKILETGELCVCQITAVLGLAPATVSKHLSLLRLAGLVSQRKAGRWVHYRLANRSTNPYAPALLRVVGSVLGDDETIAADLRRLEPVRETPLEALCAKDSDPVPRSDGITTR
ncbi:MAG: metalloregulator ArsR/SmtB family transcription factor [Azospirillum sp.]|nr:metalloregulator ArsR/SmtB family transcription factor [Azospirillum sp.]